MVELPTPVSHCPRAAFSIRRRVERRVSFGIQCHTCSGAKNFQCPPLLRNIRIGKQVCNTSSVASWCSSARIRPYSDVVCPLPIAPCSSHVTVHLRSERCSTIITGTVHELLAPARCPRMLALMAARLVASVPRVPMSHTLLNHRQSAGPFIVHCLFTGPAPPPTPCQRTSHPLGSTAASSDSTANESSPPRSEG